jgi:hypothetical protein
MGLSDRIDRSIVDSVAEEYKDASTWIPFSALEIKQIFSTPEELRKLEEFVADMQNATDDNEKKAKIIQKISNYSDTIVKVLKIAKIAV